MTVRELIEKLQMMDQNAEVYVPDCWPYPGYARSCDEVILDDDGTVLMVHSDD